MQDRDEYRVLLDTSFLIRLLKADDPLQKNVEGFFRRFLEKEAILYVSTITIAEYCRKGELTDLPLEQLRILPFNVNHAVQAGRFGEICLTDGLPVSNEYSRPVVLSDINLFAQAQVIGATHFATSDTKCRKLMEKINTSEPICFAHLDISTPYSAFFGELEL